MADTSQGEGWWQASDLKWYPPELHADADHRARYDHPVPPVAPPSHTPSTHTPATQVPMPPPGVEPGPRFEPIPHPTDGPAPPRRRRAPEPAPPRRRGFLVAGIGLALVAAVAAALLVVTTIGGDDDSDDAAPTAPSTDTAPAADPTPRRGALPGIDVTTSSAGTIDDPAAFGEVYGWPEWRGTVIEVVDAVEADLVADFDDPPPEGSSYVAVVYEATYVGGDISAFEPFVIDTPGTTVIERFACILDTAALAANGISAGIFELVPGQTARLAVCLEIATGEVDDGLLVSLDNVNVFGDPIVFGTGGSLLEPLDPPPLDSVEVPETVPFGTILDDDGWQGTVVEVFDAADAGVVSTFAPDPADDATYLAVVYHVTNTTDDDADFIPIRVTGIGSAVYEGFNSCFLDAEAMAERNVEINRFELDSGASVRVAACLDVPTDEAATLVIRLQNSFAGGGSFLLFPGLG